MPFSFLGVIKKRTGRDGYYDISYLKSSCATKVSKKKNKNLQKLFEIKWFYQKFKLNHFKLICKTRIKYVYNTFIKEFFL